MPLTKGQIDEARPKPSSFIIWDDSLRGFGVKVHPNGRKTFLIQYRLPGSRRTYQPILGIYGRPLTLKMARREAERMLSEARLGRDPKALIREHAQREKAETEALTIAGLVEQYRIALMAGVASSQRGHGSQYVRETLKQLDKAVKLIGKLRADDVKQHHIHKVLDTVATYPNTQHKVKGALHRLFKWGRSRGLLTADPTANVETSPPSSRDRVLTMGELVAIWRAADAVGDVYADSVKLMALTGQRRDEVAQMEWDEVDLDAGTWTLPTQKTKARRAHVVPLPSLAVELIKARQGERDLHPTLVLPNQVGTAISGWSWLKDKLTELSGVNGWVFHDLRRTLVSQLAEKGVSAFVLDSLLNHSAATTRVGVLGVYNRSTMLEPARGAIATWDAMLRDALGLTEPSNIVQIARAR
jgi:integrase